MSKVGRVIKDPKAGTYCQITLDDGSKITANHETAVAGRGRLSLEVSKWMGLSAERIFTCDLATPDGEAALVHLMASARRDDAPSDVARGGVPPVTPLGALVHYVKDARSVDEVKARCEHLASRR
jgi:hypothetical protein